MASDKPEFVNEYRGVIYSVVADEEENGWLIRWVRVDLEGFPDMQDDDNLFPSKDAAWAAGDKMATDLIDEVLGARG